MAGQLVLPLEPGNMMTREAFIAAPGNARALDFVLSWPDWPAPAVALYGPPASGKTHLAHIWAARSGAAHIAARALGRHVAGPLVIEDVDAAAAHEPALFAAIEEGAPLLLTGRTPPADWPAQLPDLRSRFRALLAFGLGAPDEALLIALAVKLFADRQLSVPEAVVLRLVQGLERSPAALRDFIARADAAALAQKRPVNLSLIRALMDGSGDPS